MGNLEKEYIEKLQDEISQLKQLLNEAVEINKCSFDGRRFLVSGRLKIFNEKAREYFNRKVENDFFSTIEVNNDGIMLNQLVKSDLSRSYCEWSNKSED